MYSTLLVLFFLVSSTASQATTLPQCAQGCANQAATTVKCSLWVDAACLCKTSFASSVLQCAGTTSCSAADQTQVSTILEGMCAAASASSSASSVSASASLSLSLSVSISPPGSSTALVSLTRTTITSTVTSTSPRALRHHHLCARQPHLGPAANQPFPVPAIVYPLRISYHPDDSQ
ncbi:hypothetical protein B0H12DRAFT_425565 [Mycena haematopus]|nr:hypothetical protein B0H12DRAFT_425565 [Mycena haematopus]